MRRGIKAGQYGVDILQPWHFDGIWHGEHDDNFATRPSQRMNEGIVAGDQIKRIAVVALAVPAVFILGKHDNRIGFRGGLDNRFDRLVYIRAIV
jgi:hypothetical protein